MSSSNSEATQPISSFRVLLARVLWTMVLPVVLFLAAYRIVDRGNGWFTAWDLAFWVVVALMLGCRGVEQRSGEATTLTGKASTPQHFLRYAVALLVATGLVWIIANVIGNAGPATGGSARGGKGGQCTGCFDAAGAPPHSGSPRPEAERGGALPSPIQPTPSEKEPTCDSRNCSDPRPY